MDFHATTSLTAMSTHDQGYLRSSSIPTLQHLVNNPPETYLPDHSAVDLSILVSKFMEIMTTIEEL